MQGHFDMLPFSEGMGCLVQQAGKVKGMRRDFALPDVIVNGCKPLIYLFVVGNKALYAGLQIGRKLPLKQPPPRPQLLPKPRPKRLPALKLLTVPCALPA